jgi:DNA gyrase subunit B
VLNAEQASATKVHSNKELTDIVSALGCGLGADFSVEKLRYHKVILLMDADSDGHHISTLLLTFFYRLLPALLRGGFVYLAQPPLFKIAWGKSNAVWARDEQHRDELLKKLPANAKPEIMRFKGLGEMNANELKETTLDPKKRSLLRVRVDDQVETDKVINDLMGKDAGARYRFIMERAREADVDLDV